MHDLRMEELYHKAIGHPANAEVLAWLRANATPRPLAKSAPWDRDAFTIYTHPDLDELLVNAAEELPDHYVELLFGRTVLATSEGVICAVASNMDDLIFRLPQEKHLPALAASGQSYPEIGSDWMQFDAWSLDSIKDINPYLIKESWPGRWRSLSYRKYIAFHRYWCEQSYDYANSLASSPEPGA